MVAKEKLRLSVLASGRGSNFLALQQAIEEGRLDAVICQVISNNAQAAALEKAKEKGIQAIHVDPKAYPNREEYEAQIVKYMQEADTQLVVLAGYMRLVGETILQAYPNRVVNIHPALLPSFPGLHAQRQAVEYGAKYSGCTVHFVDSGMDTGPVISQTAVPVYGTDDEDSLSERILKEEHKLYSKCIQWIAEGRVKVEGRRVIIQDEINFR